MVKSSASACNAPHAEWQKFLKKINRETPKDKTLHLVAAIDEYVAHYNTQPKPFIWTKSARDILQKVIHANGRLGSKQNAARH